MRHKIAILAAIGLAVGSSVHAQSPSNSPYKLVFDDEFNGTTVDQSQWNVLANSVIGGGYSQDQFTPSNVTVANGTLRLAATKGSPSGRPYSAGFVFTKQSFQYGYFEEHAIMPAHSHGSWPAFWMNNNGNYPEIDVFEWLGNNPNQLWSTYHPVNDATLTGGAGLGTTISTTVYSAAYHIYGMLWTPTSITWSIDGVQTFQLTQGETYKGVLVDIPSTAMQIIINSAVGGWNNNVVDSTTVFPNTYSVGYVHVYSNATPAVAITPQPNYIPSSFSNTLTNTANASKKQSSARRPHSGQSDLLKRD